MTIQYPMDGKGAFDLLDPQGKGTRIEHMEELLTEIEGDKWKEYAKKMDATKA